MPPVGRDRPPPLTLSGHRIPKIPAEMRQFVEWLGMSATEWHCWNYAGFFGGLFFMNRVSTSLS